MKIKVIKSGVTLENGVLDIGSELKLSEKLANRLVSYGCAEIVEEPDDDPYKVLDDMYKADDLKAKAVELGMTPANGISKKDLITAIVEAGKVSDFLQ